MILPEELVSEFVKTTNDQEKKKSEVTVYGTVEVKNGKIFARLDGSDIATPVTTAVEVVDGERVIIRLKDHTATITGNISSPSARIDTVRILGDGIDDIVVELVHQDAFNAAVTRITTIENSLATLQVPAVLNLESRVTANENAIKAINDTTIPELRGLIQTLTDRVNALEQSLNT